MHQCRTYACSLATVVLAGFVAAPPAFAQSSLLNQQLLRQGSQATEATGNIPSVNRDRSSVRFSDSMPDGVSLGMVAQSDILFDQPIDPDAYIVGPGDLFGVYLWGSLETSYQVQISPEGYLIIPTVGSIMIAGLSITDADTVIQDAIARSYDGLDVTIFLVQPRRFRLTVSGMVYVPGMHESHALERVSDVLERAGLIYPSDENTGAVNVTGQNSVSVLQQGETAMTDGIGENETIAAEVEDVAVPRRQHAAGRAGTDQLGRYGASAAYVSTEYPVFALGENRGSNTRGIRIHRNGEVIEADLLRFHALGDLDANPYVTSGDLIEVLPYAGSMSVYGEVHDQGFYEFKSGDRIADLIGFAGGLTVTADSTRAELVRFDDGDGGLVTEAIDLHDALVTNPGASRYRLGEGDRLYIRTKYDYHEYRDVSIGGEVRYPGQYAITKDGIMLSDIAEMTGGFTGDANFGEARLIRKNDFAATDREYERIRTLTSDERTSLEQNYLRSYLRTFAGSVNVDFEKLFVEHDMSLDVELRDGDIIYIPRGREMVNVMGAVKEPGYFQVEDGESYRFYLEKAGGYNWNADKRNIIVYKANTGQQYNVRYDRKLPIDDGDTIFVNERSRRTFWSYFSEYSGYLTTVATITLVIIQLSE